MNGSFRLYVQATLTLHIKCIILVTTLIDLSNVVVIKVSTTRGVQCTAKAVCLQVCYTSQHYIVGLNAWRNILKCQHIEIIFYDVLQVKTYVESMTEKISKYLKDNLEFYNFYN